MLRRRKSGFSSLIIVIILAVLAIVAISIFARTQFSRPKTPIEVTCSLDTSTIKETERSELTLTFNNLDLRTHEIKIFFDISPRISVYEGNERLLQQNTYTFILEASDPSEQRVFTLSGYLEGGTLSSQYPILLCVFVDGNELPKNWNDPVLTIQKS